MFVDTRVDLDPSRATAPVGNVVVMSRLTRIVRTAVIAVVMVASLSAVAPAAATDSHGGGGWPTTIPQNCPAPLSPVVPKPGGFVGGQYPGCARIICPYGYTPESPYNNGGSPVFYSIAHAIYQVLRNWNSLLGCVPSGGTHGSYPVGSLPSWVDASLCRLLGLPSYSELWKRR
jgi:hypothetical protein